MEGRIRLLHADYDSWPVLKATLVLSILAHGVAWLGMSLSRPPEQPMIRVVSPIQVVDQLNMPVKKKAPARRLARPVPSLAPMPAATHDSDGGGNPAPAARSLRPGASRDSMRLEMPKLPTSQGQNPNSGVLRDLSQEGGDSGNPFQLGEWNGTGGTGTGGRGQGGAGGGSGGGTRGGFPGVAKTAEQLLQLGCIRCGECHAYDEAGNEIARADQPRPENLYRLSNMGWDVGGGGWAVDPKYGTDYLHALYEFEVEPDGRVSKVRILRSSEDPKEKEAITIFAAMHKWTPPGRKMLIRTDYRIYRPPEK